MNILILFNRPIIPHQGGVERVSSILSAQFRKMGHNVFYLCYSEDDFENERQYISEFQLFLKSTTEKNKLSASLSKILSNHEIDIVMDQVQLVDICCTIKALPHPPAIISVWHSQPFSFYAKERVLMRNYYPTSLSGKIFKWASLIIPQVARYYYTKHYRSSFTQILNSVDRFCFLSNAFIARFMSIQMRGEASKIIAIHNPNTFEYVIPKQLTCKEKIIIMVGRVYNLSKNMGDFVSMWERLYRRNPEWKAVLVGDGPDLQRLKKYAKNKKIERIEFVGNKEQVGQFYENASISCVTSIAEGWSMVLTEAMSRGCVPVVYDSYESVHDIIQDGENGLIVPKFNLSAFCEAVQSLIDDSKRRNEMSKNAVSSITKFSPELIAKEWIAVFSSLKN